MDLVPVSAFVDGSSSKELTDIRILGVRPRKFCLWHRLLLNTIDSPFMKKGAVTMFDLRTAVGICRLRYQDCRVRRPWLVPTLIYFKILFTSLFVRRKVTPGEPNALQRALKKQVDLFLAYCKDYLQDPEYTIIPPPHGRNYTPQTTRGRFDDCIEHVGELMNWGIPEVDAWEMPIGRARVYRIMARRAAGSDIDIVTEDEREFMKHLPPQFRVAK